MYKVLVDVLPRTQVEAATDPDSFHAAVAAVDHILQYIGGETLNKFSKQQELVAALTFHLVVKRKKDVIDQYVCASFKHLFT